MKTIAIIFAIIPFLAGAQDCKVKRLTDPYTKETKVSTGFIALQGASVTMDADSKEIDFFLTLSGSDKCFDNNSTVAVFLEGTKAKLNFRNSGSMNCDGYFHINFRNGTTTNSMLQKLTTQKVTSLSFSGGNKKITAITFSPEQQTSFMTWAACLVTEAKTLVK